MIYKTQKIISIKRRIKPTDELVRFIRHNSNKRRYIWNKLVEESRKYENYNEFTLNNHISEHISRYIQMDIDNIKSRRNSGLDTSLYCSDVIKSVGMDMVNAAITMRTKDKKDHRLSMFRFKTYDPYRHIFKVRTNNEISKKTSNPKGKVHFIDETHFKFRASYNYTKNIFNIELLEPICDEINLKKHKFITYYKNRPSYKRCDFHHDDIKEIIFMEELGKFYIMLIVNVTYYVYDDEYDTRLKLAGIDLGIHNPIALYDKHGILYMRMTSNVISKIHRLIEKTKRLQRVMDMKMTTNKHLNFINSNHPIYSNNYNKVLLKFRKTWKKIVNLRNHWRYLIANKIATTYKHIVVDNFTIPTEFSSNIPIKIRKYINKYNREYGMYLFNEILKHECSKNYCEYIKSPKCTTSRCNCCGHKNQPLRLNERTFECEKCGHTIDRDANAAINCYKSYN